LDFVVPAGISAIALFFYKGDAQLAGPGDKHRLRPVSDAQQLIDNRLSGQKPYNQAVIRKTVKWISAYSLDT
jgi:hypothetical protein